MVRDFFAESVDVFLDASAYIFIICNCLLIDHFALLTGFNARGGFTKPVEAGASRRRSPRPCRARAECVVHRLRSRGSAAMSSRRRCKRVPRNCQSGLTTSRSQLCSRLRRCAAGNRRPRYAECHPPRRLHRSLRDWQRLLLERQCRPRGLLRGLRWAPQRQPRRHYRPHHAGRSGLQACRQPDRADRRHLRVRRAVGSNERELPGRHELLCSGWTCSRGCGAELAHLSGCGHVRAGRAAPLKLLSADDPEMQRARVEPPRGPESSLPSPVRDQNVAQICPPVIDRPHGTW